MENLYAYSIAQATGAPAATSTITEQPAKSPQLQIDLNQPLIATELMIILGLVAWKFVIEPFKDKIYRKLAYSLEDENHLQSVLSQIMGISNADRVTLFEFHNGEVARGGRHLNKLTPTKEVVAAGVAKVRSFQDTLLVNVINSVISRLEAELIIKTVVYDLPDSYCKSNFLAVGSHYAFTMLLKDAEGPLAILMIEFQEEDPSNFNKVNTKSFAKQTGELIYILTRTKRQWVEVLRALVRLK